MSLKPLLDASLAIQIHAFAAMAAFVLGIVQFARVKGDTPHRGVGYLWVGLMVAVSTSSFWIHEINLWRGFSPIHILSIWTLATLPIAVVMARRGNISAHKKWMVFIFLGALVMAGLFTFLPGRINYRVLFGG